MHQHPQAKVLPQRANPPTCSASLTIFSIWLSLRPPLDWMVMDCCLPVALSLAPTCTMPLAAAVRAGGRQHGRKLRAAACQVQRVASPCRSCATLPGRPVQLSPPSISHQPLAEPTVNVKGDLNLGNAAGGGRDAHLLMGEQ